MMFPAILNRVDSNQLIYQASVFRTLWGRQMHKACEMFDL
jgi:hypothetical protein